LYEIIDKTIDFDPKLKTLKKQIDEKSSFELREMVRKSYSDSTFLAIICGVYRVFIRIIKCFLFLKKKKKQTIEMEKTSY